MSSSQQPAVGTLENENKPWSRSFSDGYDYVMVFPLDRDEENSLLAAADPDIQPWHKCKPVCNEVIAKMVDMGLEIFPYSSVQGDELIILIRMPVSV